MMVVVVKVIVVVGVGQNQNEQSENREGSNDRKNELSDLKCVCRLHCFEHTQEKKLEVACKSHASVAGWEDFRSATGSQ